MIEGFAAIVIWLGLAGWSFRVATNDGKRYDIGLLFFLCLALAPFTAGAAVAEQLWPKFKSVKAQKDEAR